MADAEEMWENQASDVHVKRFKKNKLHLSKKETDSYSHVLAAHYNFAGDDSKRHTSNRIRSISILVEDGSGDLPEK